MLKEDTYEVVVGHKQAKQTIRVRAKNSEHARKKASQYKMKGHNPVIHGPMYVSKDVKHLGSARLTETRYQTLYSIFEEIKGWKNAHSDIAKYRSMQGKQYYTHKLKKDGTPSGMHDAKTYHNTLDDAEKYVANFQKLNNKTGKTHIIKKINEESDKKKKEKKKLTDRPNKIEINPLKKGLTSAIGYV